jgi:hypothetical protein
MIQYFGSISGDEIVPATALLDAGAAQDAPNLPLPKT